MYGLWDPPPPPPLACPLGGEFLAGGASPGSCRGQTKKGVCHTSALCGCGSGAAQGLIGGKRRVLLPPVQLGLHCTVRRAGREPPTGRGFRHASPTPRGRPRQFWSPTRQENANRPAPAPGRSRDMARRPFSQARCRSTYYVQCTACLASCKIVCVAVIYLVPLTPRRCR
jgi:hypothetical protein